MAIAPSVLRGRILTTTYVYADAEHPTRATSSVLSPAWTEDDRSLLLGLETYESTLCPGCSEPKETAWHADSEGEYESHKFFCHGCTAQQGKQVVYHVMSKRPDPEKVARYVPFDLLETTSEPTPEGAG